MFRALLVRVVDLAPLMLKDPRFLGCVGFGDPHGPFGGAMAPPRHVLLRCWFICIIIGQSWDIAVRTPDAMLFRMRIGYPR